MVSSASSQIEASACCFVFIRVLGPDPDVWSVLAAGNHLRTNIIVDGVLKNVANYATVQGIFIGVIAAYVVVVTIFGPEYVVCFFCYSRVDHEVASPCHRHHSSHFEKHKTAFEEGGGQDEADMGSEQPDGIEIHEDDEKASDV